MVGLKFLFINDLWNPFAGYSSTFTFRFDSKLDTFQLQGKTNDALVLYMGHKDLPYIRELEVHALTGLQGIIKLSPLISVFGVGAFILSVFNRIAYERKLAMRFKKRLIEEGLSHKFNKHSEITDYIK